MKRLPIPFILFAVSVFMILDLDGLNKLFDVINGFYLVLLLPVFLLYNQRRAWYEAEYEVKTYTLKRRKDGPKTWQEEFAGKWVKVERKGFYEFMIWNGIPSIIASIKKDGDFGQILTFDPNDPNRFELKAFGTPSLNLPWFKIGRSESDAELTDCKDPSGSPMQLKFWFDEKEKTLRCWGTNPQSLTALQTRRVDENGLLHFSHTNIKPDGSKVTYTATMRKVPS